MESTSYVLSFRMVFFYLVTTDWVFDISLCEKSINKNKNEGSLQVIAIEVIKRKLTNIITLRYVITSSACGVCNSRL